MKGTFKTKHAQLKSCAPPFQRGRSVLRDMVKTICSTSISENELLSEFPRYTTPRSALQRAAAAA